MPGRVLRSLAMNKPRILVARAVFPEVIARLEQHFTVHANQEDAAWSPGQLVANLQGVAGAFTTGAERIDAAVLAAKRARFSPTKLSGMPVKVSGVINYKFALLN